jgi:phage terminase small subunit
MGRPKNSKNPPTFGTPQKPTHLSPTASAQWDKLIKEIDASGLQVTPAHRAALFSLAATIAADIADAWAAVQKNGAYVMDL